MPAAPSPAAASGLPVTLVPSALVDPVSAAVARRRRWMPFALLVALVLVLLASLAVGNNMISPARVLDGLMGRDRQAVDIVRGGRIPRTVLGLMVGAGLGMAGLVMQSITRNPLADPGLLGVNAGASAAVVTAISFAGITHPDGYIWFALAGAGLATVVVYLLGATGRGSASPARLALAGAAITATLFAYVNAVMLLDPWTYNSFRYWDIGSLTGRSLADAGDVSAFLLAGVIGGLVLMRPLNALALGDDVGRALGAHLGRTRLLGALTVALLCGAATAAVGPIAFVGLAVPHIARMLVGVDHRWLVPTATVLGAVLLLAADVLGRVIAWPQELGVGIVTAILGAPVLVYLVRRRKIGRL